jgi:hypothetical protein
MQQVSCAFPPYVRCCCNIQKSLVIDDIIIFNVGFTLLCTTCD